MRVVTRLLATQASDSESANAVEDQGKSAPPAVGDKTEAPQHRGCIGASRPAVARLVGLSRQWMWKPTNLVEHAASCADCAFAESARGDAGPSYREAHSESRAVAPSSKVRRPNHRLSGRCCASDECTGPAFGVRPHRRSSHVAFEIAEIPIGHRAPSLVWRRVRGSAKRRPR